jgi:hypothetical protein
MGELPADFPARPGDLADERIALELQRATARDVGHLVRLVHDDIKPQLTALNKEASEARKQNADVFRLFAKLEAHIDARFDSQAKLFATQLENLASEHRRDVARHAARLDDHERRLSKLERLSASVKRERKRPSRPKTKTKRSGRK